jgi:coenzyme F420-0:L-glutamate ligase/coenzyme F420-1:gamma-L-glutamate ligase
MTSAGPDPIPPPDRLELMAWTWPEIGPDSDLGALVADLPDLRDGDVVVITSKVVSKAEGQVSAADLSEVIAAETRRVIARRGDFVIARTRHGLVMAAAGVDASNVAQGLVLSLPLNPDASAASIRADVLQRTSTNVAVVITDTAGRAWREGQTDLAIGCAGIAPLVDLHGHLDTEGQPLLVTAPAIADEIAGAADLVKGKVSRRPVAIVRGLSDAVLPAGDDGPGAAALVRPARADLFGLGARDAVEAALRRDNPDDAEHFPDRVPHDADPFAGLAAAHPDLRVAVSQVDIDGGEAWTLAIDVREGAGFEAWMAAGRAVERAETLAFAHRLDAVPSPVRHSVVTGWRAAIRLTWIVA